MIYLQLFAARNKILLSNLLSAARNLSRSAGVGRGEGEGSQYRRSLGLYIIGSMSTRILYYKTPVMSDVNDKLAALWAVPVLFSFQLKRDIL